MSRMTTVTIKGFRGADIELHLGDVTCINAGNGKGKTTILEAIRWCLTGVDAEDKANNNIFDNTNDGDQNVSVKCVVVIGGIEYSFLRSAERVGGNVSYTYMHNDYPVSATNYKKTLETVSMPLQMIKFVLNIRYWDIMPDTELRKFLMSLYQGMPVSDEYAEIQRNIDLIGISETKKLYARNAKKEDSELESIEAEVNIVQKDMPERVAVARMEKRYQKLGDELRALESGNSIPEDILKACQEHARAVSDAEMRYSDAQMAFHNNFIKRVEELEGIIRKIRGKAEEIRDMKERITIDEDYLAGARSELKSLKDSFATITEKMFDGMCPYCGAELPEEKHEEFRKRHYAEKRALMESLKEQAAAVKKRITMLKERIEGNKQGIAEYEKICEERSLYEEQLAKIRAAGEPAFSDTDEAKELRAAINEAKRNGVSIESIQSDNNKRMEEIRSELFDINSKLTNASCINAEVDRKMRLIAEIRSRQKAHVEEKLKHERLRDLAIKYEIELCKRTEEFINNLLNIKDTRISLYSIVKGEIKPRCKVICAGVEETFNTAMRTTVGIHIAESLVKMNRAPIPILVDNAEMFDSNNFPKTDCQIVFAIVDSEGGEMVINKKSHGEEE